MKVVKVELVAADVGGEELVNLKVEKGYSPFSFSSWLCPCEANRGESDSESILDSHSRKGSDLNQSDESLSVHSSVEVGKSPCSRWPSIGQLSLSFEGSPISEYLGR